jgi:hypothetical protein
VSDTSIRGPAPLTEALDAAGLHPQGDAADGIKRWQASPVMSRPNLIVPGITAATTSFFRAAAEVIDFVGEQHVAHPDLVTTDGTQFVVIPGVMPSPAGVAPFDSRPLLKEKFTLREKKWGREHWESLGQAAGLPTLWEDVCGFRDGALYPDWFLRLAGVVARVVWPYATVQRIPIKRRSSMGAPYFTSKIERKQQTVATSVENAQLILRNWAEGSFAANIRDFGAMRLFSGGYRLQSEGTIIGGGYGTAKPVKPRPARSWDGSVHDMGRVFTDVPKQWEQGLLHHRLACRSRPLTQGNLSGDIFERAMVRGLSGSRIEHFDGYFITRQPSDIDKHMGHCTRVFVGDIANNDWSQGRGLIRQFMSHMDQLFRGGGWLIDNLFRAPLLARADIREDRGNCTISANPARPFDFDSHFLIPTGNPFTAEVTHYHGAVCRTVSQWLFERANGLRVDDVDDDYVRGLLTGKTPVAGKGTGDNFIVGTDDPRFYDYVAEPGAFSPFAILDPSDTYAGNVISIDGGSGQYRGAHPNIVTIFERTLFHDRSLDSPFRGNPVIGLAARRARLAGHPLVASWFQKLDEICTRNFGADIETCYQKFLETDDRDKPVIPVFNLAEMEREAPLTPIELEFLEDPDVISWKYRIEDVRPELYDFAFISVEEEAVAALLSAIAEIGPQPFEVEKK